ncbi:hypothetical protein ACS0TY_014123 [Phlomoides rotata]
MASITYFLFLSLLFHSIFLVKCDDEDDLLQGINQFRSSSGLPLLSHNNGIECLADDIADRLKNQPCTGNTSAPQPRPSDYADLITKCRLTNATLQGIQILPVCLPESQSSQRLNAYTTSPSPYATYLNDTRFSGIGIGSDDNWTVVILTTATPGTPATPSTPDEDDLLQGINQFRSSSGLPPLSHNERVECLADDIADRLKNQPCTGNTSAPQPRPSDYLDLLTKCMLTNATLQGIQILPVCLPKSQSSQLLNAYTTSPSPYATYLNDTRFSAIGIGSDDNWTVVILTTTTPTTPATPTTPGTPAPSPTPGTTGTPAPSPTPGTPATPPTPATPGTPATPPTPATPGTPPTPTTSPTPSTPATGSNNSDSGAASLTAISPIVVLVLGLFTLV